MGPVWTVGLPSSALFHETSAYTQASAGGTPMNFNTDWFYIVMTIVAFGVLWLIVKGVERFER
jgi:hypothetical protein